MSDQWIIRECNQLDLSFIYSTWLRSYHYDSWTRQTRKSIFFDNYKRVLDLLIDTNQILVACLVNDPEVILGYIVFGQQKIHYMFVKETFRNMGIARSLYRKVFPHDIEIEITHQTKMSQRFLKDKPNLTYNPFVLYKGVDNVTTKETNGTGFTERTQA